MLDLSKIDEYYKLGRGNIFQFYITDAELQNILLERLPKEYEPYNIICYKNEGGQSFLFREELIVNLIEARSKAYDRFFLRSLKISPDLIISIEPVKNSMRRYDLQKYYIYNGLIDIQHGFKLEHKYFSESSIGLIDKYYNKHNPDQLFINEDYTRVFNAFKKGIKNVLKYRSKETWASGKINVSKTLNVSQGFAEDVRAGKLITNIEIE